MRAAWTGWIVALIACAPVTARAQAPPGDTPAAPRVEFLPRFAFHLSAAHLSSEDQRYVWDANYGGEIDVLEYGAARGTFYANYQAILGEQLRSFDPNQGNYILGGRGSFRWRDLEVALVLHHESRHLSDRPKVIPVDWNMVGGRLTAPWTVGTAALAGRADVRRTFLKSFVDYTWELDAGIGGRYPLAPRVSLVGDVGMRRLWVDGTRDRSAQHGVRGEGGVRFEGRAAAVELFVAAERRIDPYPLDSGVARWVSAGFRLVNR